MDGIYRIKNGEPVKTEIKRMFDTHGPYMLDQQRLDMLTKVSVLVDASTTTSYESGTQESKANISSAVGRAVVGGVLAGGVGAVVGGTTGKRNTTISSVITEELDTNLTVELEFSNARPIHVIITKLSSYHWLLEQLNQEPATDEQIFEIKKYAQREKEIWQEVDGRLKPEEPKLLSPVLALLAPVIVCAALLYLYEDTLALIMLFPAGYLLMIIFSWIIGSYNKRVSDFYESKRLNLYDVIDKQRRPR